MYITHAISYGNAWKNLNEKFPNILSEIRESINIITYENVLEYETNKSTKFDVYSIRRYWRSKLRKKDWLMISHSPNLNQVDLSLIGFLKNKVSLNFLQNTETLNRWLYSITPLAINNGNLTIPIAITLIPESYQILKDNYNSISSFHNKNVFTNFYLDLERISPLNHAFPFLVLGIGFKDIEIDAREINSSTNLYNIENKTIERSIEFPPEYHQAGLGILSYFGTVLREKYPEQNAKVKIEQDGLTVRLIIESENGSKEVIEKALYEYELVVSGQTSPNDFYLSPIKALELKNQLRVFQFQLESQRDVIALQHGQIRDLKELAHAALSKPMPDIRIVNQLSNTQNNSINLKNEVNQTYDQLDRLIDLSDNTDMKSRLRDLQNALDQIKNNDNPEDVKDSGAMKKLNKFLNEANETGTEAKGLVEKGGEALELIKKLGRGYNSIAKWCGLLPIPNIFLEK